MSYEIVRKSYPPPEHECELPGWWQRLRQGIRLGARLRCECGQAWEWRDIGWAETYKVWQRVDDLGRRM